jgi:rare lipoprotein A
MYDASTMPSSLAVVLRVLVAALLLASLNACGSTGGQGAGSSRGAYKVGKPYTIGGVTYVPTEEFSHHETGMASWYGPGFHGKATANGERYDQYDRTAAHRTLQMPSIVRVTNLDNGRSTVVRVNDRGPYAHSRVLDLSRAAANDLDMVRAGVARVRIEQLSAESQAVKEVAQNGGGPNDQREALERLAAGRRSGAVPTMTASAQAAAPPPPPAVVQASWPNNPRTPAIPTTQATAAAGSGAPTIGGPPTAGALVSAASGSFYVQTGAFASVANAERQRGLIASYGTSEISQGSAAGRDVYRVRVGPYTTADAAGIVADRLKRSGYGEARVVAD